MTRFPWALSAGVEVSMVGEAASVSSSPELEGLAEEALGFFDHVAASTRSQLTGAATPTSDVFAFSNFDTASAAATRLDRIRHRGKRELEQILGEPAIARLAVLVDDERPRTIYITRVTPPGTRPEGVIAASYRSPIGRLASLAVWSDDDVGRSNYIVLGRANFTTVPGVSG